MRLLIIILLILSCTNISSKSENIKKATLHNEKMELIQATEISIKVGDIEYKATLAGNETARKFLEMLPLNLKMKDLNGNEKYFNLSKNLPTETINVNSIKSGDLMLWQSNTIVLFYKDFETSYRYSRIGNIENPNGLMKALGNNDIEVEFKKVE